MLELPSPCLVVLVGLPGSGKSTWARAQVGNGVVSSDSIRALVGEGEHDVRASADAFELVDDIVRRRLGRGLTTVVDTIGNDAARRAGWRALARDHGVPCIAVVLSVDAARVRSQNRTRSLRVPESVLRSQRATWPTVVAAVVAEPFDAVHVIDPLVDQALVTATAMLSTRPGPERPARQPERRSPSSAPSRTLRFGVQIPSFTWPGGPVELGERLRSIAQAIDSAETINSLWVMDHVLQIPMFGPPWLDMPESWTTLAHLAACTERVTLGTLVSGVTYRNVAHLAKIVATLDVLSGGRAACGIGLAWYADEHRAYGWEFPDRARRYELLADALRLLPVMWGPGNKPFTGRVLNVPDTSCYPRPLQARIPILVGGSGERRTLRLVAKYADACNLFGEPDVVAHKVAVLQRHCADVGRDPAEVSVTHLSTVLIGDDAADVRRRLDACRPPRMSAERFGRSVHAGTIEQHVERFRRLAAAGVDHIIVSLPNVADPDAIDRLAAVIKRVAADSRSAEA